MGLWRTWRIEVTTSSGAGSAHLNIALSLNHVSCRVKRAPPKGHRLGALACNGRAHCSPGTEQRLKGTSLLPLVHPHPYPFMRPPSIPPLRKSCPCSLFLGWQFLSTAVSGGSLQSVFHRQTAENGKARCLLKKPIRASPARERALESCGRRGSEYLALVETSRDRRSLTIHE